MTRDLFRNRPTTAVTLRERLLAARPDQARWSHVAGYGIAGAAGAFALSAGLLTVGARVMARLPLVPRESLRGRPDVTVRAVHPDRVHLDARQLLGQVEDPVSGPDAHDVEAALGQAVGELEADARGGPGDQCERRHATNLVDGAPGSLAGRRTASSGPAESSLDSSGVVVWVCSLGRTPRGHWMTGETLTHTERPLDLLGGWARDDCCNRA